MSNGLASGLADRAAGAELRAFVARRVAGLEKGPELVPPLMNGGDDETHRDTDIDKNRLAELQTRLDGLRYRVVHSETVEFSGMFRVSGARDDRQVGPDLARRRHHRLDGTWRVEGNDQPAGPFDPAAA